MFHQALGVPGRKHQYEIMKDTNKYIKTASQLLLIKSRTLLPVENEEEDEND